MCEKSFRGIKKALTSALYLADLLLSEYLQTFISTGNRLHSISKFHKVLMYLEMHVIYSSSPHTEMFLSQGPHGPFQIYVLDSKGLSSKNPHGNCDSLSQTV